MKVKISRTTREPQAGDCYHVTDYGPCIIVIWTHYHFVVLETGVLIGSSLTHLTAKALVDATDCRRINDPITLTPD